MKENNRRKQKRIKVHIYIKTENKYGDRRMTEAKTGKKKREVENKIKPNNRKTKENN